MLALENSKVGYVLRLECTPYELKWQSSTTMCHTEDMSNPPRLRLETRMHTLCFWPSARSTKAVCFS